MEALQKFVRLKADPLELQKNNFSTNKFQFETF
jgi:hypothetical protein